MYAVNLLDVLSCGRFEGMRSEGCCRFSPTSFTNHWQKAGEIHSLAWMPQSMKMAGLVTLDFLPSCSKRDEI